MPQGVQLPATQGSFLHREEVNSSNTKVLGWGWQPRVTFLSIISPPHPHKSEVSTLEKAKSGRRKGNLG